MVVHVVAESHFAVVLLLAGHTSVLGLLHQHDLALLVSNHHQRLRGKIATRKRVLTIERKRFEVGHVGVEHDERNVLLVQLIGELTSELESGRNDDNAIGVGIHNLLTLRGKVAVVKAFVIVNQDVDMEIAASLHCLLRTLLDLFPIGFGIVLGNQHVEGVRAVVGQRRGVHVGLVIHLLESLLHFLACRFRHVGSFVQHSVNRSHGYPRAFSDVLDSDFVCHNSFVYIFAQK